MQIFGEITKIEPQDDGTIKVAGIASSGAVDEADETVLPAAMKAALPSYMRFGALREMHGMSAAGATLSAEVGEDGLTRIETHVVDPVAIQKVRLGVYKGFSIGGKVLARDPADRRIITKIKLNEISLVDRPCNPEAVIDMWKADRGPTNAEVIAKAEAMAVAAGKPGRHTDFVVRAREALLRTQAPDLVNSYEDGAAEHRHLNADLADFAANDDDPSIDPVTVADRLDAVLDDLDPDAAAAAISALMSRWAVGGLCDNASGGDAVGDDVKAATVEDLAKAFELQELRRTVEMMRKRLDQVSSQPLPPKTAVGSLRAVGKAEDTSPGGLGAAALSADELNKYLAGLPEDERGQLQLRAALRLPIPIPGR